jgi:hypothetical protein
MPNWCNNNIKITGPKKDIDKIERHAKKGDLLNFMYPMPKELDGTQSPANEDNKKLNAKRKEKYGFDCWYDWRVANWSTKWDVDVYDGSIVRKKITEGRLKGQHQITFGFDSAWAPPVNCYSEYCYNNPKIDLVSTYYEPGCDFAGCWNNGADDCIAPSEEEDSYFENHPLGKTLDDYYGVLESREQYKEERNQEQHNANA